MDYSKRQNNIILTQIYYHPPESQRPEINEYSKALIKDGNKVFVICTRRKDENKYETINNVEVLRILKASKETFWISLKFAILLPIYSCFVVPIKYKTKIGIIHIFNPFFCAPFAFLMIRISSKLFNKKLKTIFDIRTGSLKNGIRKYLFLFSIKLSILFSDKTIQNFSNQVVDEKKYKNVIIVPICISTESFKVNNYSRNKLRKKYNLNKDNLALIYLGSMNKIRNLSKLLFAFKKVVHYYPKLKLIFIGEGNDESNLILLSKKLKIYKHIIFIGGIKHEQIPKYLSMGDVGISYIPTKKCFMNQTPLKTLEYLSMSLPVVATKTNTNKSFVRNDYNGFLVEDTIESLTNGIVKVIKQRNQLLTNTRKSVREYDWNNIMQKKLKPIYKNLSNLQ